MVGLFACAGRTLDLTGKQQSVATDMSMRSSGPRARSSAAAMNALAQQQPATDHQSVRRSSRRLSSLLSPGLLGIGQEEHLARLGSSAPATAASEQWAPGSADSFDAPTEAGHGVYRVDSEFGSPPGHSAANAFGRSPTTGELQSKPATTCSNPLETENGDRL